MKEYPPNLEGVVVGMPEVVADISMMCRDHCDGMDNVKNADHVIEIVLEDNSQTSQKLCMMILYWNCRGVGLDEF